jgi:C_GCAxxG_C_C family probable redox protein
MNDSWMESVETACAYYDMGCSCAQSMLAGFGSHWDFPSDLALRIASPFGGGMGRMGEVCGAVSGALMIIGLRVGPACVEDTESKEAAYVIGRAYAERFRERRGTILCRELLSCDISTTENLLMARETDLFKRTCPGVVRDAAEVLVEVLEEL